MMRFGQTPLSLLLFLALASLAGACGSGAPRGSACANGETISCVCPDGSEGQMLACSEETEGVEQAASCICGGEPFDAGAADAGTTEAVGDAGASPDAGPFSACTGKTDCALSSLAAGRAHTCVLRVSGSVDCFGDDAVEQLGRVTPAPKERDWGVGDIESVAEINGATSLVSRGDYACAVVAGRAWCWGLLSSTLSSGATGSGGSSGADTSNDDAPRSPSPVDGPVGVLDVAVGYGHACARMEAGRVACWGANASGQLGLGAKYSASVFVPAPKQVPALNEFVAFALGDGFSCGLRDGRVFCWGEGSLGQLGDGRAQSSPAFTPVEVAFQKGVKVLSLAAGRAHVCALVEDGSVFCWGDNRQGELGLDPAIDGSNKPTVMIDERTNQPLAARTDLTAGGHHTCVMDGARVAWCWGASYALCGESPKPVRPRPARWYGVSAIHVAAGEDHTCALRRDGRLHCLGANDFGQSMPDRLSETCEHDAPVGILP